jgi:hypothetical protein
LFTIGFLDFTLKPHSIYRGMLIHIT